MANLSWCQRKKIHVPFNWLRNRLPRPWRSSSPCPGLCMYLTSRGGKSGSILKSISTQGKVESFFFFQEVTSKPFLKCGENGGKERAKEKTKKEVGRKVKRSVIRVSWRLELRLPCAYAPGREGSCRVSPGKSLLYSAKVRCLQYIAAHFPLFLARGLPYRD